MDNQNASGVDGGGLRYNAGKAPLDILPLKIMLKWLYRNATPDWDGFNHPAYVILTSMAEWQQGNSAGLDAALATAMNDTGNNLNGFALGAAVFKHVTERPVKPYPRWNWMRGMSWSSVLGCVIRHCEAWLNGQELDPETGLPHQGHIQCNLVMLKFYETHFPQGDDRPTAFLAKAPTP